MSLGYLYLLFEHAFFFLDNFFHRRYRKFKRVGKLSSSPHEEHSTWDILLGTTMPLITCDDVFDWYLLLCGTTSFWNNTWLVPASWTSAELPSLPLRRVEISLGGICWRPNVVWTKFRTPQRTTGERGWRCVAVSAMSPRRETLLTNPMFSWEKLCVALKLRESGKH